MGKRKQYLNDFSPAMNGEYVYTGEYYWPEMERDRFTRLRTSMTVAVLASVLFVLAAGMIPAAGSMNCFYVILPFLAVIICCFIKSWKAARLLLQGSPVRAYVYEKTVPALPGWIVAETVSAAATLIGEAVFLLLNGFDGRGAYTAVFICLMAAVIAADIVLRKLFAQISWKKSTAG